MADEKKKQGALGRFLEGPLGGLLMGLGTGAAMSNPVTGLFALPVIAAMQQRGKDNRSDRDFNREVAEHRFSQEQTQDQLLANLPAFMQPGVGQNPMSPTGDPVNMEGELEGAIQPWMNEGRALQLSGMFPHMEPSLRPKQEGGRMNMAEQAAWMREAIGADGQPMFSDEEIKGVVTGGGGRNDELGDLVKAFQLRLAEFDMNDKLESSRRSAREERRVMEGANVGLDDAWDATQDAFKNLKILQEEGGLLRPGSSFSPTARQALGSIEGVKSFFGVDDPEAWRLFTAFDELQKSLARATGDTASSLDVLTEAMGVRSADILRDASATMDITGDAMRKVLLGNLKTRADTVQISDTGYRNMDALREWMKKESEADPFTGPTQGLGGEVIDGVMDFGRAAEEAGQDLATWSVGAVQSGLATADQILESELAQIKAEMPDISDERLRVYGEDFMRRYEELSNSAGGLVDQGMDSARRFSRGVEDRIRGIDRNSVDQRIQDAVNL